MLAGAGEMVVQNYGLVVGLGDKGSSEVPPHVRKYLVEKILKERLGRYQEGTEGVTPSVLLEDPGTAVVLIAGTMPPGAPVGTHFDLFVRALPQTSTKSLVGGVLLDMPLHMAVGGAAMPGGPTRAWAEAGGAIFVNPFLDPTDTGQAPHLREGRIIGGGRITLARPVRLQLRRPDFSRAQVIERRINQRFPRSQSDRVAEARSRSEIALNIPPEHRDDYTHFLELVMHLPLRTGQGVDEILAERIGTAIEEPGADHRELALVWEAIGEAARPVVRRSYTSPNQQVALYAAATGLRLGDLSAGDVLIALTASKDTELQLAAIEELGAHRGVVRSLGPLRKLLNDTNERVRVAAYEALARIGDRRSVQTIDVGPGEFRLDIVDSDRADVIYATQTGRQKIVLFGRGMPVRQPVFFAMPDDSVVVSAREGEDGLTVMRRIPRRSSLTPPFHIGFLVSDLVRTLGSRAQYDEEGKIMGLELTYGEVVSALHQMCKDDDIPARLVLQPAPSVQRVYESGMSAGSPG